MRATQTTLDGVALRVGLGHLAEHLARRHPHVDGDRRRGAAERQLGADVAQDGRAHRHLEEVQGARGEVRGRDDARGQHRRRGECGRGRRDDIQLIRLVGRDEVGGDADRESHPDGFAAADFHRCGAQVHRVGADSRGREGLGVGEEEVLVNLHDT